MEEEQVLAEDQVQGKQVAQEEEQLAQVQIITTMNQLIPWEMDNVAQTVIAMEQGHAMNGIGARELRGMNQIQELEEEVIVGQQNLNVKIKVSVFL